MKKSRDPVHDLDHVTRVAGYCETIAKNYILTEKQKQALILAAWWHDVSRTIPKRPSLFFMSLIDDTLSALMLWMYTIRFGLFGSVAGMSTRLIFCKSFGTGTLFTRLLLRKKNRILFEILEDADTLDMLHVERTKQLLKLVETSALYRFGYKMAIHWFFATKQINLKTEEAKKILIQLLRSFLIWVKQKDIFLWHEKFFSRHWITERIRDAEVFLQQPQTSFAIQRHTSRQSLSQIHYYGLHHTIAIFFLSRKMKTVYLYILFN